jgi:hypothetical protein
MKRLDEKTICFSKSILMHNIVIGLFINRNEFYSYSHHRSQQMRRITGSLYFILMIKCFILTIWSVTTISESKNKLGNILRIGIMDCAINKSDSGKLHYRDYIYITKRYVLIHNARIFNSDTTRILFITYVNFN